MTPAGQARYLPASGGSRSTTPASGQTKGRDGMNQQPSAGQPHSTTPPEYVIVTCGFVNPKWDLAPIS
jgi:hypothetical protein